MRKPEFRVNYNVTLFNFVDSLSKWDYFVGGHIRKYFEKYYGLETGAEKLLEKYAKLRKELGWRKEMELFDWAYAGFPKHPNFTQLEETLHYFEGKKDKNGMVLKSEIEHATEQLENIMEESEKQFHELRIEETINQFAKLFESPEHKGVLPCYLTYSPYKDSSQGGANGEGIYTQVSIELESDAQVRQAVAVIAHEYMHKELNPGRYFQHHPDEAKRKNYNTKHREVYPDEYYQFIEEVMVYTLNDVITFKVDPEDKRNHYDSRYKDDEDRRRHFVALWQAAYDAKETLMNFKEGKVTKPDTITALDNYFLSLIKH